MRVTIQMDCTVQSVRVIEQERVSEHVAEMLFGEEREKAKRAAPTPREKREEAKRRKRERDGVPELPVPE